MKCSTCDAGLKEKFLDRRFDSHETPSSRRVSRRLQCKCTIALKGELGSNRNGKGTTWDEEYYNKNLNPNNPDVPKNRDERGSHTFCRVHHPSIKGAMKIAAANIMVPGTYKLFKARIALLPAPDPMAPPICPAQTRIKAFWCRDCVGKDKEPQEKDFLWGTIAKLHSGGGIMCLCKKSVMEKCAQAELQADEDITYIGDEVNIKTANPKVQRLDHTANFKECLAAFEWDGGQHFYYVKHYKSSFEDRNMMDGHKVEAIHDGVLVKGRKVKFLVRMAYVQGKRNSQKNIEDKIKKLLKHFKDVVGKLSDEELKDGSVIFICLPEDKMKYTDRGLPIEEEDTNDAL
jgi:hypothetical protein